MNVPSRAFTAPADMPEMTISLLASVTAGAGLFSRTRHGSGFSATSWSDDERPEVGLGSELSPGLRLRTGHRQSSQMSRWCRKEGPLGGRSAQGLPPAAIRQRRSTTCVRRRSREQLSGQVDCSVTLGARWWPYSTRRKKTRPRRPPAGMTTCGRRLEAPLGETSTPIFPVVTGQ